MSKVRYFLLPIFLSLAGCLPAQLPAPPTNVTATGYDSHVELNWQPSPSPNLTGYEIYRSTDGGAGFELLKGVGPSVATFIDWTGDEGQNLNRQYKIRATVFAGAGDFSAVATAQTQPMDDEALMEMVQRYTFRYFWDYAHPVSGLARERNNGNPEIVTTGGSGFGILSIVVATERGWITRAAAVDRMIKIISFLQLADRFHGVFPHWMDGTTGNVVPFSQYDNGGDLVETAFLMEGLLTARKYFNADTPQEKAVRNAITKIWEDVEWDWYRKNNSNVLYWHWSPDYQWQMNFQIRGFNEAQIIYLLAIASPTHGVPASLYTSGWAAGNYKNNASYYGYPVLVGPALGGPLFFAHYSYLGFDPRHKKDAFCNYFVRNRNHALIHYQHCIANPENHAGYSADSWGLTASDDPWGYSAHDPYPTNDNGTITPTAALASMPYTPQESLAALRHFYRSQGERLWGPYGFYDAFNLDQDWYASSYLAIDQGPVVAMIENARTGLLWNYFMQNEEIQPALDAAGFQEDLTGTEENDLTKTGFNILVYPNPLTPDGQLALEISILEKQVYTARLIDEQGRIQRVLFRNRELGAGIFQEKFDLKNPGRGTYFLEIENGKNEKQTTKIIVSGG